MLRAKWRGAKSKSRQKMTVQKKRRINEKRRASYAKSKKLQNNTIQRGNTEAGSDHDKTTTFKSDNARRKAISGIKYSMPSSPRNFSVILSSLITNAFPRKKNA